MRRTPAGTRLILAVLLAAGVACADGDPERAAEGPERGEGDLTMDFRLESPAFDHEGTLPTKFTCDGPNVSPELRWSDPPDGVVSLALIMDDPDAPVGTWVHWVIYDLPAPARELPEGVPPDESLPGGARQGRNDFGRIGYGGPCPPPGPAHRYFFRLYALDRALGLAPGATKAQLEGALEGHVIAEAELMGRYGR